MSNIIVTKSGGASENLFNANLTLDQDRSQDLNSNSLSFIDGKQFKWINNVAPTIGQASFDLQGFGTTINDEVFNFKNGAGQSIFLMRGNKRVDIGGDFYSASGINYMEQIRSPFFTASGINISSGITQLSRGETGAPYTANVFEAPSVMTTAGCKVFEYFNGNILYFDMTKDGVLGSYGTPTSAVGLVSGQIYRASAATIAADGNLCLGIVS